MEKWLKILGIIFILVIAFLFVISMITFIGISMGSWDPMGMLIVAFSIYVGAGIVLLWLICYFINWIVRK
jgi:hypothetical protein